MNLNIIRKKTDLPLVSIVTPVYNGEKYIEETIKSIINQSYQNIEYIIIDGKSNDNTLKIINKYYSKISKIISQSDAGQVDAINHGFSLAKGEILGWLNYDDILLPNAVERIVNVLKKDNVFFTYGHTYLIDHNGNTFFNLITCKQTYFSYRYDGGNIFQGTVMFKRDLWNRYGPLNINYKYMFEYILFDEFFKNSKGKYINHFLAKYRIHNEAISSKLIDVGNREKKRMRRFDNILLKIIFKTRRIVRYIFDKNFFLWIK